MSESTEQSSAARPEGEVEALVRELVELGEFDQSTFERLLRRYPRRAGGFFSKSDLIRGFRHLNRQLGWQLPERPFLEKLRMKPVRTQSGVAPLTVLTKPFPCPGQCIFCPSDVRMPKSYLSSEPGAQRAAQHRFDPYAQSLARLRSYYNIGHPVDKVELIILGGTWTAYPEPYQIWFTKRCIEALNAFGADFPAPPPVADRSERPDCRGIGQRIDGRRIKRTYNSAVRESARGELPASAGWDELAAAQRANENAVARCVGLVVETRPDHLTPAEIVRMRRLGATKVQIGYQSLSDDVLASNRRGHDVAATRRAMRLLREGGFKIHAHWMPNLLGSSPENDLEDFDRIFADPDFRPDELKIYPCSLLESAELMADFEAGRWRPYSQDELLDVVTECMRRTPEYCRLTRIVRDIPGTEIVAGSRVTNLREVAEARLREVGAQVSDIRAREIRHRRVVAGDLELRSRTYRTSLGREIFLQYVTSENRVAAFLRLSLPGQPVFLSEIRDSAMIREVHVYGWLAAIGQRQNVRSQHLGLGRRLLDEAARLASSEGFTDLAVISSIGTRPYYRKLGFVDGHLYQHRRL